MHHTCAYRTYLQVPSFVCVYVCMGLSHCRAVCLYLLIIVVYLYAICDGHWNTSRDSVVHSTGCEPHRVKENSFGWVRGTPQHSTDAAPTVHAIRRAPPSSAPCVGFTCPLFLFPPLLSAMASGRFSASFVEQFGSRPCPTGLSRAAG